MHTNAVLCSTLAAARRPRGFQYAVCHVKYAVCHVKRITIGGSKSIHGTRHNKHLVLAPKCWLETIAMMNKVPLMTLTSTVADWGQKTIGMMNKMPIMTLTSTVADWVQKTTGMMNKVPIMTLTSTVADWGQKTIGMMNKEPIMTLTSTARKSVYNYDATQETKSKNLPNGRGWWWSENIQTARS